ncbi:MAG TPA: pyridoxal 5'-phosphate synthase glutaminase subunit PdxT [Fimbriimonadaceae bacterium]|nr:pyridoxal 5'-phosphate synthase glutaminase subunit PdxT [Fimbriimonadaceae bacterium]
MAVGVISIQGDFEKHLLSLSRLGVEAKEVRTVEDLPGVNRIIIPGGESTTVGMLMQRFGLGEAIQEHVEKGMPIWGTCMGMILLAKEVVGRQQYTLDLLDITVERNAFGAQVHSFEDELDVVGMDHSVTAVFIRAPVVTAFGPEVKPIATYEGKIVAVQQGNRVGTSFHPELTDSTVFHEWFCRL